MAAPAAAPAPWNDSAPEATRGGGGTERLTWAVVAAVALLVIAALATVAVRLRQAAPADPTRPEGVVLAYEEAIDTGHAEAAWDLLASPARAGVTRDEFVRRATRLATRREGRLLVEQVRVEGSVARVEVSRTMYGLGPLFGPSTPAERMTVQVMREGGQWRIEVPPEPWLVSPDGRSAP